MITIYIDVYLKTVYPSSVFNVFIKKKKKKKLKLYKNVQKL
jgi:hypothetical protein